MKSLLLVTPFFRPNVGGVETRFDELTKALSKKDINVFVVTFQPLITKNVKGKPFEKVENISIWRHGWIGGDLFHKLLKYPVLETLYLVPIIFWCVLRFLIQHEIKVIHAAGLNATLACVLLKKIFGFRLVSSTHALYNFKEKTFFSKVVCVVMNQCNAILAIGEASRKELTFIGVDSSRIFLQPTWVNLSVFKPLSVKECKRELKLNRKFVAGFVGRLNENKGVGLVLKLAEKFKDITFVFVGTGSAEEEVQKASQVVGSNVKYFGRIENYDLPRYYNAMDLFLASALYPEGYTRSAVEALSCGVPILASNMGCLPEIVIEGVGWLVEPSFESFSEKLFEMVENKKGLLEIRKRCAETSKKRYSEDRLEEIIKVYKLG